MAKREGVGEQAGLAASVAPGSTVEQPSAARGLRPPSGKAATRLARSDSRQSLWRQRSFSDDGVSLTSRSVQEGHLSDSLIVAEDLL
jgi:hypothetical protein